MLPFQATPTDNRLPCQFPYKKDPADAGYDIVAQDTVILFPLIPRIIRTNISIAFPSNRVFLLRGRSGMGSDGFHVLGGVVDSGYRGEVKVCLINLNLFRFWKWFKRVKPGDRIAQGLLIHIDADQSRPMHQPVLPDSVRGGRNFGSSGR